MYSKHDAFHIDVENRVNVRAVDRIEMRDFINTCIGEYDIYLLIVLLNSLVKPGDISGLCDVTLHTDRTVTNLFHCLVKLCLSTARNVYVRAFKGEKFCCSKADAITAPGYHDYFIFKSFSHLADP